jgi:tetratricopeptide (TPR) repeat protein
MTNFPSSLELPRLLIEHRRFKEAENALRQEIAANPDNARAYAFLALALHGQGRAIDGLEPAREAVGLAPDDSFTHFALAVVYHGLDQLAEALQALQEAIRLNPENASYHSQLSSIHMQKGAWQDALDAAEVGRALAPEDEHLANLQAMALTRLGRKQEAQQAIAGSLARNPDNPLTHANQGWALLHAGDHEGAMRHFREALRLEPMLDWARRGIIESMRARNPVYRVLLKYFLWMSRLSPQARWGVVLGGYVLYQGVSSFARANPQFSPIATPLIVLYMLFALLTWVGRPLTDLLLRLDRFGRLALTPDQTAASNWVGACLLLALVLALGGLITGGGILLVAAVGAFAMILPVSGTFQASPGKRRGFLAVYTLLLALTGASSVSLTLLNNPLGGALSSYFLFGWVAFSWIANFVLMR